MRADDPARSAGQTVTDTVKIGDAVGPRGFSGLAGVAVRDVTPPVGIRNRSWGPATVDIASGVHRSFVMTALAVAASDGGDPAVVFGVDATWWRSVGDYRALRDGLLNGLELPESRVLFCLSHTHSGVALGTGEAGLPGGEMIPRYLENLRDAAISAGREAIEALQPAMIEWATGRCDLAANREAQIDGRAVVAYNPMVRADDTVIVGRVSAPDGHVLGTIVNYACHPTTLAWQNELLSPDYVGAMRETVERDTGAPCLFLQGASGDLAPREQYVGDTAVADRHGTALGHAVLAALSALPPAGRTLRFEEVVESGAPLGVWRAVPVAYPGDLVCRRHEVEMPLQPLPTLEELAAQWVDIDPRSRDERLRRAAALRDGYIDGPSVIHPLWTLRLGDAVIVAHPGEAYSAFQTELRARFPGLAVIVVNLANGPGFVYLPDSEAYRRGAYQAWQTVLAPGGLRRLTDAAQVEVRQITA